MDHQPPTFSQNPYQFPFYFLLLLFFSIVFFNLSYPFHAHSLFSLPQNQESSKGDCDYSSGRWVFDDSYSLRSYTETCPFLDPGFRCLKNGREDDEYRKWRWQPYGCDLPRFDASDFLERSRNGKIIFAGDSIGRNQWESLICMLAQAVSNKSTIYEANGNLISKHKGHLSMKFHDYNLTVEYYRVPFLVTVGRPPQSLSSKIYGVINIDKLHWYSGKWASADVLVFNAGHWWNQDKTIKMGYYFQEGNTVNMTMNVVDGFQKALQTWKTWAVQNLDSERSHLFFRSYSPVHYRDGTWNEGGHCNTNKKPETNHTKLQAEPWNNIFIADVIKQMANANKKFQLLNITYLTELRNDGHPSVHREPGTPVPAPQDCSHWCLPGVPDTWNTLLYGQLLAKGFRTR